MNNRLNSEEWVRHAYVEQARSLQDIARELGCSRNTVRNRLIQFDIPRRPRTAHFVGRPQSLTHRARLSEARRRHWEQLTPEEYRDHVLHISEGKRTKDGVGKQGRRIYVFGRGRVLEHRYVMEQILGRSLDPSEHIHHLDGNRLNNDPANLKIVTNREHQTYHAQKLSEQDVFEIRQAWDTQTNSQATLARQYGVAVSTIHRIVHRQRWKHLP